MGNSCRVILCRVKDDVHSITPQNSPGYSDTTKKGWTADGSDPLAKFNHEEDALPQIPDPKSPEDALAQKSLMPGYVGTPSPSTSPDVHVLPQYVESPAAEGGDDKEATTPLHRIPVDGNTPQGQLPGLWNGDGPLVSPTRSPGIGLAPVGGSPLRPLAPIGALRPIGGAPPLGLGGRRIPSLLTLPGGRNRGGLGSIGAVRGLQGSPMEEESNDEDWEEIKPSQPSGLQKSVAHPLLMIAEEEAEEVEELLQEEEDEEGWKEEETGEDSEAWQEVSEAEEVVEESVEESKLRTVPDSKCLPEEERENNPGESQEELKAEEMRGDQMTGKGSLSPLIEEGEMGSQEACSTEVVSEKGGEEMVAGEKAESSNLEKAGSQKEDSEDKKEKESQEEGEEEEEGEGILPPTKTTSLLTNLGALPALPGRGGSSGSGDSILTLQGRHGYGDSPRLGVTKSLLGDLPTVGGGSFGSEEASKMRAREREERKARKEKEKEEKRKAKKKEKKEKEAKEAKEAKEGERPAKDITPVKIVKEVQGKEAKEAKEAKEVQGKEERGLGNEMTEKEQAKREKKEAKEKKEKEKGLRVAKLEKEQTKEDQAPAETHLKEGSSSNPADLVNKYTDIGGKEKKGAKKGVSWDYVDLHEMACYVLSDDVCSDGGPAYHLGNEEMSTERFKLEKFEKKRAFGRIPINEYGMKGRVDASTRRSSLFM